MKKLLMLLLCCCIALCLGCKSPQSSASQEPLDKISSFSGERLENYPQTFATIKTVTLYVDGIPYVLESSDSRVVQLLNYISYTVSEDDIAWIQGAVTKQEMDYVFSNTNRLEITFEDLQVYNSMYDLNAYERLIVTTNWCTVIRDVRGYLDVAKALCYEDGKIAHQFSPESIGILQSDASSTLLERVGLTENTGAGSLC